MTYILLGLVLLFIAEKAWKHALVVYFFRRPQPTPTRQPRLVSILQPIVSGDPTLPSCLEENLRVPCRYPREFLWLVDQADLPGQAICQELIARYPAQTVRLIVLPSPVDRCTSKMHKLLAGIPQANGDVLCVLESRSGTSGHEEKLARLEKAAAGRIGRGTIP